MCVVFVCVYVYLQSFALKFSIFFLNWQCKFLSWIFVYLVKTGFIDKRAIWDPVTVTSLSTGFLSQISSHRLVYDSYPLYLQIEILRISLLETKYNQNRVKNPRETSMFLWKSLEMFVMVTGEVSGIRLPRFLIIAFSSTYCMWHNFSFLWFIQTRWIMLIVKRYWCLPWILQPNRIWFWFRLGLCVISLIGCEEYFNLRFVIERRFQHYLFFNNHTVFHGWTFQKT